jgi:hypothetical protein
MVVGKQNKLIRAKEEKESCKRKAKKNTFKIPQKFPAQADGKKFPPENSHSNPPPPSLL